MPDNGDETSIDLGLPLEVPGAGDGELVLENGLLRFCVEFEAMMCSIPNHRSYMYVMKQHNFQPSEDHKTNSK